MSERVSLNYDPTSSAGVRKTYGRPSSPIECSSTDTTTSQISSDMISLYRDNLAVPNVQRQLLHFQGQAPFEQHKLQDSETTRSQDRDLAADYDNYSGSEIGLSDPESVKAQWRGQTVEQRYHERGRNQRFRLTHKQTRFLMSEFARQPHPDATERQRLSREIPGLSPRQVQIWFQNRRAKLKRLTTEDRNQMIRSRMLPEDFQMSHTLRTPFDRRSSLPGDSYARIDPRAHMSHGSNEFAMNRSPMMFQDFRKSSMEVIMASPSDVSSQSSTSHQSPTYSTSLGYTHHVLDTFPLRGSVVQPTPQSYSQNSRASTFPSIILPDIPQSLSSYFGPTGSRTAYFNSTPRSTVSLSASPDPGMASSYNTTLSKSQNFQTGAGLMSDRRRTHKEPDYLYYGTEMLDPYSHDQFHAYSTRRITHSRSYEALPHSARRSLSPQHGDQQIADSRTPRLSLEIPTTSEGRSDAIDQAQRYDESEKANSASEIAISASKSIHDRDSLQSGIPAQQFQTWDITKAGLRSASHTPVSSTQLQRLNDKSKEYLQM